jgi:hypothetical protein
VRAEYLEKLEPERLAALRPRKQRLAAEVDYGY